MTGEHRLKGLLARMTCAGNSCSDCKKFYGCKGCPIEEYPVPVTEAMWLAKRIMEQDVADYEDIDEDLFSELLRFC